MLTLADLIISLRNRWWAAMERRDRVRNNEDMKHLPHSLRARSAALSTTWRGHDRGYEVGVRFNSARLVSSIFTTPRRDPMALGDSV